MLLGHCVGPRDLLNGLTHRNLEREKKMCVIHFSMSIFQHLYFCQQIGNSNSVDVRVGIKYNFSQQIGNSNSVKVRVGIIVN